MTTLLWKKYPVAECKKLYLPQGCALFCVYSAIYIPIKFEERSVMIISKAQLCKD